MGVAMWCFDGLGRGNGEGRIRTHVFVVNSKVEKNDKISLTSTSSSSSTGHRGPWLVMTPRTEWRERLEKRRLETSAILARALQTVLTVDRPAQD